MRNSKIPNFKINFWELTIQIPQSVPAVPLQREAVSWAAENGGLREGIVPAPGD